MNNNPDKIIIGAGDVKQLPPVCDDLTNTRSAGEYSDECVDQIFPQQRSDGVFSPWVLERVPERVPRVPERVPGAGWVPEQVPEREQIPEQVPERVPEQVPERFPERVPERFPERVPERVPEQVLERVPDQVPFRSRFRKRFRHGFWEGSRNFGSGAGAVVSWYSRRFMWFRVANMVLKDVSCGFAWPVWYSKCFI